MREFKLEAALAGERVVTRDGREVTQMVLFQANMELWPVVGVLDEVVQMFSLTGKSGEDHVLKSSDLFMADTSFYSGRTEPRWPQ